MSGEKQLKGVQALLSCEQGLASGQLRPAPETDREATVEQLKESPTPIRAGCVDDDFCRRVLVAVDDSQPATWALRVAIKLAKVRGAHLALVHVIHGEMALTPEFAMPRPDVVENVHRSGEEFLRQEKSLAPAELHVQTFLKVGDPSQQIVTTALNWEADLIVIGTHGRAGISHMLIGGTAESVVRRAHCPVLTVGHDPTDQAMRLATEHAAVLTSFSPHPSERTEALVGT